MATINMPPTSTHPAMPRAFNELKRRAAAQGVSIGDNGFKIDLNQGSEASPVRQRGDSLHQWGLAFDITVAGNSAADWKTVAGIAKEMGLEWGGDWSGTSASYGIGTISGLSADYVHFQIPSNILSVKQIKDGAYLASDSTLPWEGGAGYNIVQTDYKFNSTRDQSKSYEVNGSSNVKGKSISGGGGNADMNDIYNAATGSSGGASTGGYNVDSNNPLSGTGGGGASSNYSLDLFVGDSPFNPHNPLVPNYKPVAPPPSYFDDLFPEHRTEFNPYRLRIGDCEFVIPPIAINVETIPSIQSIQAVRQKESLKSGTGYCIREINFNLFCNGFDQINGYEVEGPSKRKYYMDGARPLVAQFKRMPFLPIVNEFINGVFGIYAVTLYNIVISTEPAFPNTLRINLSLREFNTMPYTCMPSGVFDRMICWPLFRWYYQEMLSDEPETTARTRCSKMYTNVMNNIIRFRIIPEAYLRELPSRHSLNGASGNVYNFIDEPHLFMNEIPLEYDDFQVETIDITLSNIISNLQMAIYETPTHQYMGSMDTVVRLSISTQKRSVMADFIDLNRLMQRYSREYKDKLTCGFIGINNELLQMFGMNTFVITGISISTIEDNPNLFNIQLTLSSYNQNQKRQERFHGVSPMTGSLLDEGSGASINSVDTRRGGGISVGEDEDIFNVFVSKSNDTWDVPIIHDCFMEDLLQGLELYPDLELPSYPIVNSELAAINEFRKKKGFREIYTDKTEGGEWIKTLRAPNPRAQFVDPDFYIFYPTPFVLDLVDETLSQSIVQIKNSAAANVFDAPTLERMLSGDGEEMQTALNQLLADIIKFGARRTEKMPTESDIAAGNIASDISTEYAHYQMACYDMFKYHKHGTMLRAFPTYMFLIIDEGNCIGGVRLWSNYYAYHSMIGASVIRDMDNPIDVCEMQLTNVYHTLNTVPQYTSEEMQWLDENTISTTVGGVGALLKGLGSGGLSKVLAMMYPTVDERIVELKRKIHQFAAVQAGARIHLRMGYGQDISGIPTVFNGIVTSVTGNEVLSITAQGDGCELINPIHNSKPGSRTTGRLAEPRMALAHLMCEHGSGGFVGDVAFFTETDKAFNIVNAYGWGVPNAHGVEHFGKSYTKGQGGAAQGVFKALYKKFNWGGVLAKGFDDEFVYELTKNIYPGGIVNSFFKQYKTTGEDVDYIENAGYERGFGYGEKNIEMYKFGKSIWDIGKYFCLASPEYILSPHMHHFRSTLFFGRPHWICRYGYIYTGSESSNLNPKDEYGNPNQRLNIDYYRQLVKPFMQFHILNSYLDIIDNGMIATSEDLITCSIPTYNDGTATKTVSVWADRNMAPECIKTAYLDTTFVMGLTMPILEMLPNAVMKAAGYNNAAENAYQAGVSHLSDSFRHMYDGDIIMLGHPALKPYDCMYLGDYFSSMYGCSNIRKVVNTIDVNTGFITSVTPGLITFGRNVTISDNPNGDNDKLVKTYGAFLMIGSNYDLAMTTALRSHQQAFWNNKVREAMAASNILETVAATASATWAVINTASAISGIGGLVAGGGAAGAITAGAGAVAAGVAAAAGGLIIGGIAVGIYFIGRACIDFYLKNFTQYYTNTIMIMPLFIKDKPLLAGCRGYKTLLPPGMGDYAANSNQIGSSTVVPSVDEKVYVKAWDVAKGTLDAMAAGIGTGGVSSPLSTTIRAGRAIMGAYNAWLASDDGGGEDEWLDTSMDDTAIFRKRYQQYEQRMLGMLQNKRYGSGAISIFEYIESNAEEGWYEIEKAPEPIYESGEDLPESKPDYKGEPGTPPGARAGMANSGIGSGTANAGINSYNGGGGSGSGYGGTGQYYDSTANGGQGGFTDPYNQSAGGTNDMNSIRSAASGSTQARDLAGTHVNTRVETFIQTFVDACNANGIPPSIGITQGVLESTMGNVDNLSSTIAREANNILGITASSTYIKNGGDYYTALDGNNWRKYNSVEECIWDYASNVMQSRNNYAEYLDISTKYLNGNATYNSVVDAIARSPYCAGKYDTNEIWKIINKYDLQQYDTIR